MVNSITRVSISVFSILLMLLSPLALAATEQSMTAGQSMTVEGKSVEVLSIGKQSVVLKVGDESFVVYQGNERTMSGIRIGVSSVNSAATPRTAAIVSYSQDVEPTNGQGAATLSAGESASMEGASVKVLSIGKNGILVMSGDKVTTIANGQSAIIGSVRVTVPSDGISTTEGSARSVKLSMTKISEASTGTSYKAGNTFEAGGKNVTVMSIGKSTVRVRVGEDSRIIAVGGEDTVSGVKVAIPLGAIGKADDGKRAVSIIVTDTSARTEPATREVSKATPPEAKTITEKSDTASSHTTVAITEGKEPVITKETAKSDENNIGSSTSDADKKINTGKPEGFVTTGASTSFASRGIIVKNIGKNYALLVVNGEEKQVKLGETIVIAGLKIAIADLYLPEKAFERAVKLEIAEEKKAETKVTDKKPEAKSESKTTTVSKTPETKPVFKIAFEKTVSKGTVIRDIPSLKYGDSIKINGKTMNIYTIGPEWVGVGVGNEIKTIKKAGSSKENTIGGMNVILSSTSYNAKNFKDSSVKLIVTP